jgi:phytanoyl-CoA hydroxylase
MPAEARGQLTTHPLSTDFEWKARPGPYRIVSDVQARQYDEQGWFVFEDAFDAETIRALTDAIDPIEAQFADLLREKMGGKFFIARADEITFTTHIVTRSAVAKRFTQSAFFCDLAHDLIGPDVRLYWDQSVYKKPGTADEFPWHQDNGYTFVEPQQYLTCWVALTDADEENGCPWVAPRLHHMGTLAHEMTDLGWDCVGDAEVESVAAPVRAGSVVVFSSLTPHRTGPNLSDRLRKTYIVQFAPDGADVLVPRDGGGYARTRCDAEERQYFVLKGDEIPG